MCFSCPCLHFCCVLVLQKHNKKTLSNPIAQSSVAQTALQHNTLLQGGLETQEDLVITYKDMVIIPSASSYLGHFLNNVLVAHRQALFLIIYS